MLLWVNIITHAFFFFGEAMVLPIFPKRPRYTEYPRTSKLARRVLQLLATKTLVMMECPKGPKAAHA